ncbi:Helix-turn-helix domain containing protein [uncultured Caudovirales phage]|uniref:Helix-turn-helix domain containing protein n=1 Tax=uncultured Caudovirales phage TaxID=2100421 RepID=A0A6J5SH07_9CAUD|nr:Helix-turn-helix domain containing protein [uncultured Caudovirales phage]
MSEKEQKYLSLAEASKYMGNIHRVYLRELARSGAIPAVKFSKSVKAQWYFLPKEIDAWAKKNGQIARDNLANKKSK